jgi:hypothetical protein
MYNSDEVMDDCDATGVNGGACSFDAAVEELQRVCTQMHDRDVKVRAVFGGRPILHK